MNPSSFLEEVLRHFQSSTSLRRLQIQALMDGMALWRQTQQDWISLPSNQMLCVVHLFADPLLHIKSCKTGALRLEVSLPSGASVILFEQPTSALHHYILDHADDYLILTGVRKEGLTTTSLKVLQYYPLLQYEALLNASQNSENLPWSETLLSPNLQEKQEKPLKPVKKSSAKRQK